MMDTSFDRWIRYESNIQMWWINAEYQEMSE